MFILRTITNGVESNTEMGSYYAVYGKDSAYFKEWIKGMDGSEVNKVVSVVACEKIKGGFCIFDYDKSFVMSESGKTFANLSVK